MSAVANIISDRRTELARWAVCFLIVAAAHGLGAMALMSQETEASDFGVDTPVMVVDLPESFITSPAPALDLPPGPLQEEQSDPTPPQREETKPPEPQAELSLPMPEPPKPEPPSEERQATAPPQANAPRAIARWESALAAHLERFKRYPQEARARGEQGTATVAFTIDHNGRLVSSRIVQSSGFARLDQETLAMLARAQPMPKPPDSALDSELSFVVPVRFNIR
ncbi:MAG TPA: energy transducer TonB [Xanthobacteraceae bacterium]|nr:energy transducer TonB [Xanthobacteraceae bacterium]